MSAAVKNPMFREAIVNHAFESVSNHEEPHVPLRKGIDDELARVSRELESIDPEELKKIKRWAHLLRIAMISICSFTIFTAFYNIGTSSSSVSTGFISMYVFVFASLLCCYEVGWRQVVFYIVQNFGFMYNPVGRMIFIVFTAILCFEISTL